jgi:hypothetical protein
MQPTACRGRKRVAALPSLTGEVRLEASLFPPLAGTASGVWTHVAHKTEILTSIAQLQPYRNANHHLLTRRTINKEFVCSFLSERSPPPCPQRISVLFELCSHYLACYGSRSNHLRFCPPSLPSSTTPLRGLRLLRTPAQTCWPRESQPQSRLPGPRVLTFNSSAKKGQIIVPSRRSSSAVTSASPETVLSNAPQSNILDKQPRCFEALTSLLAGDCP